MTRHKDLKARLLKDPEVRRAYDALEEEFALILEVAKARRRAGLSQAELAKRMKTTQSTIARLESGRGLPSRSAGTTPPRIRLRSEPMSSKTLALAAAALLVSALAANAQSSSNPSMQPNPGGASKAEEAGTKSKPRKMTAKKKKADDPSQSSSTPSMAPTPGTATGKIENEGKQTAKVKGKKKQATPANSDSSTPAMAPTK